ncbi:MAG: hypothetical protein M3O25_05320 [Actinomycetota bacterium]|nr:hypothetical protein [Actinomycetota bacterium]
MTPLRTVLAAALALTAALAIAACGGDDGGGDEDATEVLQATFSNQETVDSGVFAFSIDLTSEGGEDPGSFKASFGGPFQGVDGGFPSFDIDAQAELDSSAQDFSGDAGLTSTGEAAFLSFQGSDYAVPQQAFDQFATTFTELQAQTEAQGSQQSGNFLASIGIDPTNWLTDVANDGTEDVEGTETIHVSGQADVPKLVEDLRKIAESAPQGAQQATPEQLSGIDELTEIIESAEFDLYTGSDDDILRKLEASLELSPSTIEGSPDSVTLDFAITLSELNEPQEIAAPADAQPLQGLLDQFGVDPGSLGDLGAGLGSGGELPQAGGSAGTPGSGASQAYLECLQTASGAAALQQCAALLQ